MWLTTQSSRWVVEGVDEGVEKEHSCLSCPATQWHKQSAAQQPAAAPSSMALPKTHTHTHKACIYCFTHTHTTDGQSLTAQCQAGCTAGLSVMFASGAAACCCLCRCSVPQVSRSPRVPTGLCCGAPWHLLSCWQASRHGRGTTTSQVSSRLEGIRRAPPYQPRGGDQPPPYQRHRETTHQHTSQEHHQLQGSPVAGVQPRLRL